jgi:mannosyl-oligosaccharide alpha-1,2-mannosidase
MHAFSLYRHVALLVTCTVAVYNPQHTSPRAKAVDSNGNAGMMLLQVKSALTSGFAAASATRGTSQVDLVRDALRHLWQGYRAGAWGSDEVRPISGEPGGKWGDVGMQILDAMDTLWLADMHKEFDEGQEWVSKMRLDGKPNGYHTSFFEMTIRGLGGLLSCYALSGRHIFLEQAQALGRNLHMAFPQEKHESAWPAAYLDVRNPVPEDMEVAASWLGKAILADMGSNLLEFTYLSEISGDPRFRTAAVNNEVELLKLAEESHHHLAPKYLDSGSHKYVTRDVSVGAYADSYFEYLLKGYLRSGRTDRRLLESWRKAMQEMKDSLVRTSEGGYTFIASGRDSDVMEELSCFMGGLLALGSHLVPKEDQDSWWLPVGAAITHTCYQMYKQSPSGLAPETAEIGETIRPVDRGNRMRPETLESLFYLYRITGNETYKQWSSEIFNAINSNARTEYGFATVADVTAVPVELVDSEETFVGAETLKYALLVHLPATVLPLDRFVLNTEAHPLPVGEQGSSLLQR